MPKVEILLMLGLKNVFDENCVIRTRITYCRFICEERGVTRHNDGFNLGHVFLGLALKSHNHQEKCFYYIG